MVPVGHNYRPEGKLDARSALSATILGVVTAIFAALVVWAWELSPVPTLVIITPLLQGLLIGLVLAFVIGRLRLRHPNLLGAIGLLCGLSSVGLVHYGHYLHFLDEVGNRYKAQVEADDDLSPEKKAELLGRVAHGSGEVADEFLVAKTGHSGFLGSMIYRGEVGVTIKRVALTGWGVWILWGVEALAVALVAGALARSRAAEPFCEDCGDWCSKARAPIELAGESARPFAEAVHVDDLQSVALWLREPVDPESIKQDGTRATLHSCGGCDQTFVDVESYLITTKKKKTETKTTSMLKQVRISPEMTALLRQPPSATSTSTLPAEAEDLHEPAGAEALDR